MKREHRLRSRLDFTRTSKGGKRISRPQFQLSYVRTTAEAPRVGLAVGRSLGGAVVRNRIRRRLREAVRPLLPTLLPCDIVIAARPPAVAATPDELRASLSEAIAEARLLRPGGSLHNGGTDPD